MQKFCGFRYSFHIKLVIFVVLKTFHPSKFFFIQLEWILFPCISLTPKKDLSLKWVTIKSLAHFCSNISKLLLHFYILFTHEICSRYSLSFYRYGNWCPKELHDLAEALKLVLELHFLFSNWINFLLGYTAFWNHIIYIRVCVYIYI